MIILNWRDPLKINVSVSERHRWTVMGESTIFFESQQILKKKRAKRKVLQCCKQNTPKQRSHPSKVPERSFFKPKNACRTKLWLPISLGAKEGKQVFGDPPPGPLCPSKHSSRTTVDGPPRVPLRRDSSHHFNSHLISEFVVISVVTVPNRIALYIRPMGRVLLMATKRAQTKIRLNGNGSESLETAVFSLARREIRKNTDSGLGKMSKSGKMLVQFV